VKEARMFWISRRLPFMRMTPHRLVFVDETSTNTKMTRLRGRALCGNRLRALAPFGRWGTQTFIAGLRLGGLTAPWVLDGPLTGMSEALCKQFPFGVVSFFAFLLQRAEEGKRSPN
jgi:hypothetical protein